MKNPLPPRFAGGHSDLWRIATLGYYRHPYSSAGGYLASLVPQGGGHGLAKGYWGFARQIFPLLLIGVFSAGILKVLIPESIISNWVGGNCLRANFLATIFGAFMYFATLTEVPIVKAFMELGTGKGPALALLLAGPALSLPNMLVIRTIMGNGKTLTDILLVIIMATFTGFLFGLLTS